MDSLAQVETYTTVGPIVTGRGNNTNQHGEANEVRFVKDGALRTMVD